MSEHERVMLLEITTAVRAADQAFEKSGGSSRHWVRDCLLPALEERGLEVACKPSADAQAARDADRATIEGLEREKADGERMAQRYAIDLREVGVALGVPDGPTPQLIAEIERLCAQLNAANLDYMHDMRTVSLALSLPPGATVEAMCERAKRLAAFVDEVRRAEAHDSDVAAACIIEQALAALDGGSNGD